MDANRFIHEERLIEESLKENEDIEKARKRKRDRKRDKMDESVNFFLPVKCDCSGNFRAE